ncbi:nucleotidyltransferase domain-containing protein [Candidatus Saccharibacteria bacterium]|nr:nucleotidyltransferase domain-containing protein [Clostridia bacterium]MBR0242552.1 nucleotidyltransferase domain-containing protein [Candidatus Saccharibacteria bacterium]
MLTISEIRDKVAKIGKKYGIKNAYLFGSYAKGVADEKSDIDIIIDRGEVNTYDEYFSLHEDLVNELGTEVDLLATDGVKPRFFELIKNDRILLYGA